LEIAIGNVPESRKFMVTHFQATLKKLKEGRQTLPWDYFR
jgi:hypothetical protein